MKTRSRPLSPLALVPCVVATSLLYGLDAEACSASQTEVYRSEKSVWCAENAVLTKYGPLSAGFFTFGDDVVTVLPEVFDVPAEGVYTFEVGAETGYAHTGSECCGLGVTVTGDAFYNEAYGVAGWWGYLLSLHEMINDWTGQVSSGWPTDFWADHISAYPNSLDWHLMERIGNETNNEDLKSAAVAQKARFYPGGGNPDQRVVMFDQIFDLPNFGFDGYSRMFGYVQSDQMSWDALGVPNADVKRTEYVMAYLSLAAGQSVTAIMQAAHVGDGTPGSDQDVGYVASQTNIDAIANAHCALVGSEAQGNDVSAGWASFRGGDFAGVAVTASCGDGCPGDECACDPASNHCVARWLGVVPETGTGGASTAGSGGSSTGGKPATASGGAGTAGEGGAGSSDDAGTSGTGCGCSTAGNTASAWGSWLGFGLVAALARRRALGSTRSR